MSSPPPSVQSKNNAKIIHTAPERYRLRTKPKRLRSEFFLNTSSSINNNDDDDDDDDTGIDTSSQAYEIDHMDFFNSMYRNPPTVRPLPAISTMLAIKPQHRESGVGGASAKKEQTTKGDYSSKNIPLLREFFDSVRHITKNNDVVDGEFQLDQGGHGQTKDENSSDDRDTSKRNSDDNDIDLNQCSTVVTSGHHKRFTELLLELEKEVSPDTKQRKKWAFRNQPARRNEFRKLCDLFQEERRLYVLALNKFCQENIDKFLIGFRVSGPASEFVHVNAEFVKGYIKRWNEKYSNHSNKYGPYTQAISLHETGHKLNIILGGNMFNPTILKRRTESAIPKLNINWEVLLNQNKKLKSRIVTELSDTLLCDDAVARKLAITNNVDMIVTSGALEALLRQPGSPYTRWTIPGHFKQAIFCMEDPLPTISTPRECLSVGIREALYNHALELGTNYEFTNTNPSSKIRGQHTYTLLTIPYSTSKQQKILVRSTNYLMDENERPLIFHSQLEYFVSHHGVEEFTCHERAIWLLNKILQKDCRVFVGRVDPNTAEVLALEEKSVADAMTSNDVSISERYLDSLGPIFSQDENDIMRLFQNLSTVLVAAKLIEKIDNSQHVICLPGRTITTHPQTTATVHKALQKEIFGNSNQMGIVVDIEKELNDATAVLLDKNALLSCFRSWRWKFKRLPFTFPMDDEEEEEYF